MKMQKRKLTIAIMKTLTALGLAVALLLLPSLSFATGNVIGPYYAQRNTTTIVFPLTTVSSTTQALYSGATFPAGEVKVSTDGGAFANSTNTPAEIGSTGIYTLPLTTAEMSGDYITVKISKGSVYEDLVILLRTNIESATMNVTNPNGDAVTFASTGAATAYALHLSRASGGGGTLYLDNLSCSGNCWGLLGYGYGTGSGIKVQGGSGSGASGFQALAAGTNGAGIYASGGSDQPGIYAVGAGTQPGIYALGGAGGAAGLEAIGQAGGSGIYAHALDANGHGLQLLGFGTGSGLSATGGSGSSYGIYAVGNIGAYVTSAAVNGTAASIVGTGSGVGLDIVSSSGTAMSVSTSGSYGLSATGGTHGIYGSPDIYPVTLGTSVWNEVSGAEPSAGPTWGASTYGQFLSMVTARFYNKVTQTASAQSVYKTGGVTVMATGTVSDDGVTQTKGQMR